MFGRHRGWLAAVLLATLACDDGGGGDETDACAAVTCPAGEACTAGRCLPVRADAGGGGTQTDAEVAEPDAAAPEPDVCVPGAETCNGADDDCDGITDEAIAESGDPCEMGVGACFAAGELSCVDGALVCSADAGMPGEETCNGADDDCDGTVDEGQPGAGAACEGGVGVCAAEGVTICAGGEVVCDVAAGEPGVEACNELDDDCDGTADEDFANLGDPCQIGIGLCERQGALGCVGGEIACLGENGEPLGERCNGEDDDCDGIVDEADPELGDECSEGVGGCEAEGVLDCVDAALVCLAETIEPGVEACNAADDDCDGAADEDFDTLGDPCTNGVGACEVAGAVVCGDAGGTTCDAVAGDAGEERCNEIDDDCDGATDEAFADLGTACEVGIGACFRAGVLACDRDGAVECNVVAGEPVDEICNGLDDDCDESTDESFDTLGDACEAGVGQCLRAGEVACDDEGGVTCRAIPGDPTDETCNGLDDDCDDATDEHSPQLPEHCGECGRACDIPGAFAACADSVCVLDRCKENRVNLDGDDANGCEAVCVGTDPPDEVCDGIDNDCDGVVDGPEICANAFGFCARRQGIVDDIFCEAFGGTVDFDAVRFPWSPARPGGALPAISLGRYTAPADDMGGDEPDGGGHTARLRRTADRLKVGYEVRFTGGRIGVGVFLDNDRLDGDPANPGNGYGLEVLAGEPPEVRVVRYPDAAVVAAGPAPALVDEGAHRATFARAPDGRWTLRVDGALVPLTTDEADETHNEFNRLTFYADAQAGAQRSSIDNVTVQDDRDGDDRYLPDDNCPHHPNPDQADADGNGRGTACDDPDGDGLESSVDLCPAAHDPDNGDVDGDGVGDACYTDGRMLLVELAEYWTGSVWAVDPVSGVRHRLQQGTGVARTDLTTDADGRLIYVEDQVLYRVDPVDGAEREPLALGAAAPQALADGRVLYSDAATGDVMQVEFIEDAPFASPYLERQVASLRVFAVRGGTLVVVARGDAEFTEVEVVDLDGERVIGSLLSPNNFGDTAPYFDLHPTDDVLLASSVGGDFTGTATLSAGVGFVLLSDAPTVAARWSPNGTRVHAIEQTAAGRRLVERAAEPGAPATPVILASDALGDSLGWLAPADPPAPADLDGDGRHDRDDLCPAQPPSDIHINGAVRVDNGDSGVEGRTAVLQWQGSEYTLAYHDLFDCCSFRKTRARWVRLDAAGMRRSPAQVFFTSGNLDAGRGGPPVSVPTRAGYVAAYGASESGMRTLVVAEDDAVGASRRLNADDTTGGPVYFFREGDSLVLFDNDGVHRRLDLEGRPIGGAGNIGSDGPYYGVPIGGGEHIVVAPRGASMPTARFNSDGAQLDDWNDIGIDGTYAQIVRVPGGAVVASVNGGQVNLRRINERVVPIGPVVRLGSSVAHVGMARRDDGAIGLAYVGLTADGARRAIRFGLLDPETLALRMQPVVVGTTDDRLAATSLAWDGRAWGIASLWWGNTGPQQFRSGVYFEVGPWECQ